METPDEAGGYYRLAFGGEETTCLDYHATGDVVQASGERTKAGPKERSTNVCVSLNLREPSGPAGAYVACVPYSFSPPVLGTQHCFFSFARRKARAAR